MRSPLLFIDDEPENTYFLRRVLNAPGVANPVVGCAGGEEAMRFLEGARFGGHMPAIVFLDLKLPGMDGLEVLKWIKAQPEFRDLKVVVLSSSNDVGDRERALELGAHAYAVKFPDPAVLARFVTEGLLDRADRPPV